MKSRSFEVFSQLLKYVIKYFGWLVSAAVVLIILSGLYRVENNEVAVVLRFGRLVGHTPAEQIKQPGLHFAFPSFIDEVIKVPVQTVQEKEVITHYGTGDKLSPDIKQNGYLLTGDHNVVLIKAMIKYTIGNAVEYALYSSDTDSVIDGIVSGELTQTVTHMDIDSVLTSGKAELASRIMADSQAVLDELKTGILITNVELTDIMPPVETKQYFEEVINATVSKQTSIEKAREYASTTILQAEAEANSYKQAAISEQASKLTVVRNEIAEFNGLYDQYIKDPQIIINGTFRQRVSALLAKMGGSVIVPDDQDLPTVIILP